VGVVVLVLGGSLVGYQWLGAPLYPDVPLAARIASAEDLRAARPDQATAEARANLPAPLTPDADFALLMDRLRSAVAARPDDVTGLALLAQNESSLGNFAAARTAQRALIAAKGAAVTAQDHAALAEMMVALAGGYVSPEAEAVLTQSLTLDPANPTARYYAGLMMGQVGRFDLGFRMWQPLADGPADAVWMPAFRAQMPDMAARAGVAFELPATRGPSAADIAAAADMTPADRAAMIAGMVSQLSERLATEGGPPEDWAQLISALLVTGDADRAETIRREALQVFAGNAAALDTIRGAAAP
jgi:cytochrome c-type biogenesis protein CcmH